MVFMVSIAVFAVPFYLLCFLIGLYLKRKKPHLLTPVLKRVFIILTVFVLVALSSQVIVAVYGSSATTRTSMEETQLGNILFEISGTSLGAALVTLLVLVVIFIRAIVKSKNVSRPTDT